MSGFRLGFGVVSVLFGPSARGPVEVLADLGGAIDFNTKRREGLKTMFSIFSLWARTNLVVPLLLVGLLKLLKLLVALGASWGLPRPLAEPWLGGPLAGWKAKKTNCWGFLTVLAGP